MELDETKNQTEEGLVRNQTVDFEAQKKERKKVMRKGVLIGVLVTLFTILVLIFGGLIFLSQKGLGGIQGFNAAKLSYITSIIRYYYYDEVEDEALADGVYKGVMESLKDPYSVYYTKQEYEELMIDTTGNYAGIGAVLTKNVETGAVHIVNVYDGSPAQKAGLMADDVIISAGDAIAADLDLDIFVQSVRGQVGTSVTITYVRDGQEHSVDITREQVSVPKVSYKMLEDKIGYIEITEFSKNTQEQFDAAMADLQSQGMKAVIFDMRYNGGGLVDSVVAILDEILPKGTTVYMEDKRGERTTYASDDEHFLDLPMVVLTSKNTASAAEIFAGAIRDFDYGTLVGTTTFGKGIVQSTIPLPDGSAVKVTMARYFTPSGECIHKVGIHPDVELEYEFLGGDDETYTEMKDNQILKAIEILNEK